MVYTLAVLPSSLAITWQNRLVHSECLRSGRRFSVFMVSVNLGTDLCCLRSGPDCDLAGAGHFPPHAQPEVGHDGALPAQHRLRPGRHPDQPSHVQPSQLEGGQALTVAPRAGNISKHGTYFRILKIFQNLDMMT